MKVSSVSFSIVSKGSSVSRDESVLYALFILLCQVNALLNEVTLKESQRTEIDRFIEEIATELRSIPEGKVRPVSYSFGMIYTSKLIKLSCSYRPCRIGWKNST